MKLNSKKIELELERLGKTHTWLANEMGVPRQRIHVILNNANSITLKTVTRIGRALGIDPKDLCV